MLSPRSILPIHARLTRGEERKLQGLSIKTLFSPRFQHIFIETELLWVGLGCQLGFIGGEGNRRLKVSVVYPDIRKEGGVA